MGDATIVAVAKAVETYVSADARAYGTTASYTRTWRPLKKIPSLVAQPHVFIYPAPEHTIGLLNRHSSDEKYRIDVTVQKKVASFANSTIDALALFFERIYVSLFNHDFSIDCDDEDFVSAHWVKQEHVPFNQERLHDDQVFEATARITYEPSGETVS